MKRSAPVLVRADGTRVELAGYDICIRVPPLVSHVSHSPAGVRLTGSLSKGERIEDGDRVVYPDGTITPTNGIDCPATGGGDERYSVQWGRPVLAMNPEECPVDRYQHCWHYTGRMRPTVQGQYHEVCCWCGGQRWAIRQPLKGPHGPHLTKRKDT